MASTGPQRPLVGGISIPQWMRSKISDRYDLEQPAFSPPTDEDGFFLIRYPKFTNSVVNTVTQAPESEPEKVINTHQTFTPITPAVSTISTENHQHHGYSALLHHTEPCQQFIPQAKITPRDIGLKKAVDPPLGKVKSTGTDDGFKGDGAACGYSVMAIAQQMLSGKQRTGGATVDDSSSLSVPEKYERVRRNSKSLPASPQTSPKLLRKNPYFTNILFGSFESVNNEKNMVKKTGGLFAAVMESQNSSVEDLVSSGGGSPPVFKDQATAQKHYSAAKQTQYEEGRALRAKPSQLREMNFWSPTSM